MIERRGFITGLVSLVAAPAIVRAGSLMPIKADKWIARPGTFFIANSSYQPGDIVNYQGQSFMVVPSWVFVDLEGK